MSNRNRRNSFLSGIQVLDLADEQASFCSKLLADMGARVIKVERPGGDPSRNMGPFYNHVPHPEKSLFFWYHNANKEGVTLDLENPAARPLFFKMIAKTDILIETFPPGYLQRIGLGFQVLKEENPGLIAASVTGFGQNGPRSRFKANDLVVSAYGGQMHLCGYPFSSPLKPFGEQSCYASSLTAAIGILLALRRRSRTGRGEEIEIAAQEAVVATLDHVMTRFFYDRVIPGRQGNMNWTRSFAILPCKDGPILINLFQQWETLVEWMESEGMAEDLGDPKWKEEEVRLGSIAHVIEVMQKWTQTHTARELFELGQLLRFPWAPVQSLRDVLACPQLEARQFFMEVDHPLAERPFRHPGSPCRLQDAPAGRRKWKRAPLIGEDNLRIYQKELGVSAEEMQRLAAVKAI